MRTSGVLQLDVHAFAVDSQSCRIDLG